MDTLSFEIVAHIASFLPLDDALSFAETCRAARAACNDRIDPDAYLVSTFRTPRYLLAAMTDFGCVLSGSRALEYFVPGSARANSDWDFLVPCVESSTLGMMDALEKCGVKWEDPFAKVMALAASPAKGGTAQVRAATVLLSTPAEFARSQRPAPTEEQCQLFVLLHAFATACGPETRSAIDIEVVKDDPGLVSPGPGGRQQQSGSDDDDGGGGDGPPADIVAGIVAGLENLSFDDSIAAINSANPNFILEVLVATRTTMYMLTEVSSRPQRDHRTYLYYGDSGQNNPIRLINGYITPTSSSARAPKKPQKVQLFQCHSASDTKAATPLEYIIDTYYATHVQCFLGGWAAGHFFYDLARQQLALNWPLMPSYANDRARRECIRKYRQRGFRFFSPQNPLFELGDACMLLWHGPELGTNTICPVHREHYIHVPDATALDPLSEESYKALCGAVPASMRCPRSCHMDSADTPSPPPKTEPSAYHLGHKGTLAVGFNRLQKTLWGAAKCGEGQAKVSDSRVSPDDDAGSPSGDAARHCKALFQSLDVFSWHVTQRRSFEIGSYNQLAATERILPHLARWQCPPDMSKFKAGRFQNPWFVDDRLEGQEEVVAPRAKSLRDHYAAGVLSGRVPSSTTNNREGVTPEAVAQACTPWHLRGKVRARDLDRGKGRQSKKAGGGGGEKDTADDDAYVELESREELWDYFRYLVKVTPTACHNRECWIEVACVLPPQI